MLLNDASTLTSTISCSSNEKFASGWTLRTCQWAAGLGFWLLLLLYVDIADTETNLGDLELHETLGKFVSNDFKLISLCRFVW